MTQMQHSTSATVKSLLVRLRISAVMNGHIYEIKSTYILQPGPAALTEGVRQLHAIIAHVAGMRVSGRVPEIISRG